MDCLSERFSVRRSCDVLGFRRQTYYRRKMGHRPDVEKEQEDQLLANWLLQVTSRFVAWGFWKVFYYLRLQGCIYNNKRVYRVWRELGLHLRLPPKRKRIYRKYQKLLAPKNANEGWAMDFLSDWIIGAETEGVQKQIRIVNIMDEGSRRALWTEAHRSISAKKLVTILDQVVAYLGKPKYIRCDNGPEFISSKLQAWAVQNNIELRFIQPGKPSQNGLIERLNKTLRVECLNLCWFHSMEELNDELQTWSMAYNFERPHENLNNLSPDIFEQKRANFYSNVVAA
ncbi:IS3 family transposase [Aureispira anguillae]|uniref:IS3 family transposase n=1 Tax=Aureispira anguillae TaxID=2864201 RepID=A0A915YDD3_9BACT|nr:IS3 family transposase [Aureispira anguillae]BDS09590.1 IS3 family transposase [Aureispira anguillae]BDS10983.1 IS3 family transposase [Aureispira anguillae]